MRNQVSRIVCLVTLVWIAGVTGLHAQTDSARAAAAQTASAEATAVQQTPLTPAVLTPVPRVIWFNGAFRPANKLPVARVETVTVAVYRERDGGDAVWQETQIVTMEADGRYSLLMGSTSSDGMPLEVFTSGEPRWIGITVNRPGEAEQPRVHLASVPYALKAADTDTLGGKPASAYLLAGEQKTPHASKTSADAASTLSAGTPGYLGMFVDPDNLGNSALYQNGAAIGLGTLTPRDSFHVTFTDGGGGFTGYAVQNLSSAVNAYSGMLFYDQAGATAQFQGFNNTTHEYRVNNVASGGTINLMIGSSSKVLVANNGNIGVGVAVPGSKLDVEGDVNLTGSLNVRGNAMLRVAGPDDNSIGLGFGALAVAAPNDANTALGSLVLGQTTTGGGNTGVGTGALGSNTTGSENTVVGLFALADNTTGGFNTAVGTGALTFNETGEFNLAVGYFAGSQLDPAQSNNIDIDSAGEFGDSATIRIGSPLVHGRFFTAGVRGVTTDISDAVAVVIDSAGQLGTVSSSRRFKEDIHDMGDASRGLMRLRPVTFRYKTPFKDGSKPIQYGLIAEEVAAVYPDLVAHSADGQIETVKYQVLDAMLLNEVQQLHAQVRAVVQQNQDLHQQNKETQQQNKDLQQRLASLEAALAGRR